MDERLFVALKPGDVRRGMVVTEFIDLQGQSCNRERHSKPQDVLLSVSGATGYATVRPMDFPGPVRTAFGIAYFFQADDLPESFNEAHAEIRPHRKGHGFNKNHRIKEAAKAELKSGLAAALRIEVDPAEGGHTTTDGDEQDPYVVGREIAPPGADNPSIDPG